MSRIFIALTPKDQFNKDILGLKENQKKLIQKGVNVNWTNSANHHITINFVGSMEPEQKEEMFGSLENLSSFNEIPIEVTHLSYFPNENGQVLIANINLSTKLKKIFDKVEEIVARIGFGMTLKTFRPHITLARFKEKNRPFSELIELEEPIVHSVNTLDVYESNFDSGKTVHSLIKQYNLTHI